MNVVKIYDQYKDDSEAVITHQYCKLSDISSNKLYLSQNK